MSGTFSSRPVIAVRAHRCDHCPWPRKRADSPSPRCSTAGVFRGPERWTIRHRPATNGDAIINKIDLHLDDPAVQNSAVYEAEQADLNGATADHRPPGQSGAGTADIRRGQNVTFWVDSTSDGYSDLAFRYKDAGAAGVTVNGLSLGGGLDGARGGRWSTRTDRGYLSAGINKGVVTGDWGEVTLG